jgi:hypothetical protein
MIKYSNNNLNFFAKQCSVKLIKNVSGIQVIYIENH